MKYLRMAVPHKVVAPASIVTEGSLLNVQLLPDGNSEVNSDVIASGENLINLPFALRVQEAAACDLAS
jgi:hypothetical protein